MTTEGEKTLALFFQKSPSSSFNKEGSPFLKGENTGSTIKSGTT